MIPSEGAHDSNEQNVNDASKLGGEISEKAYRKAKVAGKFFFSLISPLSQSLSLSP